MWDHTAVAADSKLVVSLVVGKRTQEQPKVLVQDAKNRLRPRHLPALFTEAYVGYEAAILETFGRRYPVPRPKHGGRPARPQRRWPHGLASGQVQKVYTGKRVERVEIRVIHSKARLKHVLSLLGYKQIHTSVVERHNGTSRLRNQRKVRKTLAFSKACRYHQWMSWLSRALYNFCRPHGGWTLKQDAQVHHRSPAVAARLTDHIGSVREWLLCPVLGGQG